ncbi:M48 family metallopeptidase [bacterium]|nr:M48 family metallopeptidase [bacterium]
MSTSKHFITVSNLEVEVVRKPIKNLHLAVYPPNGRIRVAVPNQLDDDNVRLAIITRMRWIKRHQSKFIDQPRQSAREFVSGESHYFMGRRYLLEVNERYGRHEVVMKNNTKLILYVNPGTTRKNRELALYEWYRDHLKKQLPELITKWEQVIGVKVNDWSVKRMRTRWGTCNIKDKRVWINLEIAKKPIECLEYILVHEMIHLLERLHNDKFKAYMDKFYPKWEMQKKILNSTPLAHEEWGY